jgi:hypothetical protein
LYQAVGVAGISVLPDSRWQTSLSDGLLRTSRAA